MFWTLDPICSPSTMNLNHKKDNFTDRSSIELATVFLQALTEFEWKSMGHGVNPLKTPLNSCFQSQETQWNSVRGHWPPLKKNYWKVCFLSGFMYHLIWNYFQWKHTVVMWSRLNDNIKPDRKHTLQQFFFSGDQWPLGEFQWVSWLWKQEFNGV